MTSAIKFNPCESQSQCAPIMERNICKNSLIAWPGQTFPSVRTDRLRWWVDGLYVWAD